MYSGMMPNMDYLLLQRPVHPCKMLSSGPISGSFFDVFRGFIQSVNTMESTVLVPTLLKDINLEGVSWLPTLMVKCNYRQLFEIYCAIKKCKTSFFQVDIDEVENGRPTINENNNNDNEKMTVNENPLLVYAIESGMNYLTADYVIDYCQHLEQQQSTPITTKVPEVPSPSPSSSSTLSSSSGSNLSRKQKISLDSGNWSSRESDSIDDDFEFESDKGNGQQQSTTGTLNYPSIDSVVTDPIVVVTAVNNTVVVDDQSQSNQQPSLATLLRATSNNLRNLKVLCNHLKEVADFVTQQYLEALQLI